MSLDPVVRLALRAGLSLLLATAAWHKLRDVGAFRAARVCERDPAPQPLAEPPSAGDMVGMDMRLERHHQVQTEFAHQRAVARHLLEDGIDQHRLAALVLGEKVGIGRGLRIEELAEQHRPSSLPG